MRKPAVIWCQCAGIPSVPKPFHLIVPWRVVFISLTCYRLMMRSYGDLIRCPNVNTTRDPQVHR